MRPRLPFALVVLAISFALPTFAQQKETVDPKLGEAQAAFDKKIGEAYNNNDAAAVAADDAVEVTNRGPVYGRQAIDKYFESLFQNVRISNYVSKADPVRGIRKGMADNEMWTNGEWSGTIQVKGANPVEQKGYWSSIKVLEGDTWKIKMGNFNVAPQRLRHRPQPLAIASNKLATNFSMIRRLKKIGRRSFSAPATLSGAVQLNPNSEVDTGNSKIH